MNGTLSTLAEKRGTRSTWAERRIVPWSCLSPCRFADAGIKDIKSAPEPIQQGIQVAEAMGRMAAQRLLEKG
jgi:hypothetical protein